MNPRYFIKFDPRINQLTGCQRATLILSSLEYWFTKKPDGFYKFMEPCSHRLYRRGDSWEEELGCERRCFARSFKKIGIKYKSRMEFDAAPDKFQGKMYASYYDRYTNRTFFIRNHTLANEFLKDFSTVKTPSLKNGSVSSKPAVYLPNLPLSTGQNGLSYIEAKNTPNDLSKDKSHAGNEIIKKMIDIWTAIVGEGREQIIELRGKLIPFLKKALTDKFDNCLQQWKEYCKNIARSKFLMGEKTSFKADLEWALKFESIRKVLSGDYYGIGDRSRKLTPEELEELEQERQEKQKAKELKQQRSIQALEEEIKNRPDEPDSIKNFRIKWLNAFGEQSYREFLESSTLKVGDEETDLIIQPRERITAIRLESHWNPEFLSGQPFSRVQVYHCIPDFRGKPLIFDHWLGGCKEVVKIEQERVESINPANGCDELPDEKQSAETNQLRAHLKARIHEGEYPAWLDVIKVQAINPDGILVATFKDKATSDYARIRFSEKILNSASSLWNEVAGLIICEESDCLLVHDREECLEIDEKTLAQQAIQSLMEACFSGTRQMGSVLDDYIPY
jgi:hypothetical protein